MSLSERNLRGDDDASIPDIHVRESMPTKWTDEKHNLYLNSMEAMFVTQLYNLEYDAVDSPGWSSRRKNQLNPSTPGQSNARSRAPHQFMILERGFWRKIHSTGSQQQHELNSTNLSKHDKLCGRAINISRHPAVSDNPSAIQSTGLHQPSLLSFKEVSDQNFVEDETRQTNPQNKRKRPRSKSGIVDSTFNDQVVPSTISTVTVPPNKHYDDEKEH